MRKKSKMKRATKEQTKEFTERMRSCTDSTDRGTDATAGPGERPGMADFTWLDDAVLESLDRDALLSVSIRYRDIITRMMEERKELTDAFFLPSSW